MSVDLLKYTEQAVSLLGGKFPDLVYLPPDVRKRTARVTTTGAVTREPYSLDEQLDRVVQADPVGFLIALMHGQPVVTFQVASALVKKGAVAKKTAKAFDGVLLGTVDGAEVYADFHTSTPADRERIASFFTNFVLPKARTLKEDKQKPKGPVDEFASLARQRAGEVDEPDGA